ncbi:MAG: helix-hairpin-helix domain-containing protein [Magnetococcus sp. YQC-3]
MVFYNIFKKTREKEENQERKKTIIADHREKNSLVIANIIEKGILVEFRQLEIGDFIINDVCIERKTYSDFVSSMISKRIFQQLEEIKKFPSHFLIIEGKDKGEEETENESLKKASKGLVLSILTKYKIPIIFAKDEQETAEILILLANKQNKKELSLRPSRSLHSLEEQKQFILEGFPQIGPATAKKLLNKFKTIKNVINAEEQELREILGKKFDKFREILQN